MTVDESRGEEGRRQERRNGQEKRTGMGRSRKEPRYEEMSGDEGRGDERGELRR